MRIVYWLAGVLLIALLAGCGGAPSKVDSGYTVVDGMGRSVHVPAVPRRVWANTVNLEDLCLELVGPERMAAVSSGSVAVDGLNRDRAIQVSRVFDVPPSPEELVALQPDLVVLQEREMEMVDVLTDMGLVVFVVPVATDREMVAQRIALVAAALGVSEKGDAVLDAFRDKLARCQSDLPVGERPIAIAYSAHGAFGGKGGLMDSILVDAGLRNGAALVGLKRNDHLSKEEVVMVNPDYFILPQVLTVTNGMTTETLIDMVRHDPAYQTVSAIQDDHIVLVPDRYRYCNSHHYADAVGTIHDAVYRK